VRIGGGAGDRHRGAERNAALSTVTFRGAKTFVEVAAVVRRDGKRFGLALLPGELAILQQVQGDIDQWHQSLRAAGRPQFVHA
jgi:hypothetical protein